MLVVHTASGASVILALAFAALSACKPDAPPVDTSSLYPPGLAPLEDCTAPAPEGTETQPTPELLNVLSDSDANPMWVHARGYVHAPITQVWAGMREGEVMANRREVAEWTITPDADPTFDYGFTIHNTVHDVITIQFDMHYDQGVILGTPDAPEHVAGRRAIVEPDIILKVMEGSILLTEVSADVTELQIVEWLDTVEGEVEPAISQVEDFYASLVAWVHGDPLPEYD